VPVYISGCVCVSVLILKPAELKLPALTSLPTATEKGPKACHELEFSKGVRWFFGQKEERGPGGRWAPHSDSDAQ